MKNDLRIGFLLNNNKEVLSWEATMIKTVREMPGVNFVALISAKKKIPKRKSLGLKIFEGFESIWFGSSRDAFKKDKSFDSSDIYDIDVVNTLNLDMIYKTNDAIAPAGLDELAKYGLWYLSFGIDEDKSSAPVAFWEVMRDEPQIRSSLYVKRSNKSPMVIYEGGTNTVPYSVKNSRNSIGWRSASYLVYRLNEFLMLDPDIFFSKYESRRQTNPERNYPSPQTLNVAGLFIRNIFRYLRYKTSTIFSRRQFTILYSTDSFDLRSVDLSRFKALQLPANCFWADPFIIERDKKNYVFFEEFNHKKGKAHISMFELDERGQRGNSITVLEKPYHLSYPFLFEDKQQLYMIPETAQENRVELYCCQQFPDQWQFVSFLLKDAELIDPTILFYEGKWWLFGTKAEPSFTSTNDQLFLYWNESLLSGDWKPHPQNPVVTQISNCRPAGRIFFRDEKLYRPAQNNASKLYGYAICINEIEVLNEREYKEKKVAEILPDGERLVGVHTINFTGDFIVIDGIK